jgi:glutamate synthase (ferredoxin)
MRGQVRKLLSELGFRSLDELIGRADLLRAREELVLSKTEQQVDMRFLTELPDTRQERSWLRHEAVHDNGPMLDDEILRLVSLAIKEQGKVSERIPIANVQRSVGARLAGQIAKRYGNKGFQGELELRFQGAAGQSFGAFAVQGMKLLLEGEANDYVGKGMNGGLIAINPSAGFRSRKDVDLSEQVGGWMPWLGEPLPPLPCPPSAASGVGSP